ncbi:MAG: dihydrodipicolinate reductase, partial [Clostridiales bacterium]|nr:dihydrodipicolinate reductase [Clostridiales bacterium]
MNKVKAAIWGFGAMGSGIAKIILNKNGIELAGVCDSRADKKGADVYETLGVGRMGRPKLCVSERIEDVLAEKNCDICVIATDSFVKNIFDKVVKVLTYGINVITIAEEMSYPKAQYPELADEIDRIARQYSVSVLGTGINPGLVMDLLAVCLSGCMTDVNKVTCRRVNSLSPFGEAVMSEQGVGLSVEEFERRVQNGSVTGHVGFAESVRMISDATGLGVDRFEQRLTPIVTAVDRKSPYGAASAGSVAGVDMRGQGLRGGKLIINMEHPQQIEPGDEGVETGDYIVLDGDPPVSMSIKPEISGGLGTIAMCVNCIPHVINAAPGLKTMIDIPVPRAIMGDFRNFIDPD